MGALLWIVVILVILAIVGAVALGLVAYAAYTLAEARYRRLVR